jgi:asparagine synthase (glutamine-hydrolysing)
LTLSEAGSQPMASANGALQIVFNGEIYNFREQRHRLENKGFALRSDSDTEVLLQLYADKSMEMLRDVRGMYALSSGISAIDGSLPRAIHSVLSPTTTRTMAGR